jgi:hypothetical protein
MPANHPSAPRGDGPGDGDRPGNVATPREDHRNNARQPRAWLGLVFAVAYLALSLGYLGALVLEATPPGFVAYVFTWDMFPGFATRSVRRVALGQTASGDYVVLHPSPWSQFREGVGHDLTRVDLDRSGVGLQSLVETVRLRTLAQRRDNPIVRVLLCEQSWPVKFNFRDDHYTAWTGEPKPVEWLLGEPLPPVLAPPAGVPSATWRILREYPVQEPSEVDHTSEPSRGIAP